MTQTVVVTGKRISDDVTLVIDGRAWGGWTEVRITRGIERLPSDFELHLTERFPGEADAMFVNPGDACQVKIGGDLVMTGYVDRVIGSLDARQHTVTVTGRSKCQDLVDCAAEWAGGQIVGSSVLEIARKLAEPYGITVDCVGDPGDPIPQFNLMRGETPFEIIERLCRFRQLLAYDMPDGNLRLSGTSLDTASSGFKEGVNVVRAAAMRAVDQQFSEYRAYLQSVATLEDIGPGGDLLGQFFNTGIKRHRLRIIVAESSAVGQETAKDRAAWEAVRRWARSADVRLTTDSWRDSAGRIYSPNTLALVDIPSLKVSDKLWTISEVTYRMGSGGTACEVAMMSPDGFRPQPTLLQPLPLDVAALVSNLGRR
jgi:prophage tail gpP-like protein